MMSVMSTSTEEKKKEKIRLGLRPNYVVIQQIPV